MSIVVTSKNDPGNFVIVETKIFDDRIEVTWKDSHVSKFHHVWLRDQSHGSNDLAEGTSQRLFDFSDISPDIRPNSVSVNDHGHLLVDWDSEGLETSSFDPKWLRENCYSRQETNRRRPKPVLWDAESTGLLAESCFTLKNNDHAYLSPDVHFRILARLIDFGFVLLGNIPPVLGQVAKVADLFGFVRETNYGKVFDVIVQKGPSHLAYTNSGLRAHTDNPYRNPIPGIQFLHCIAADAEGGETILIDGFKVANDVHDEYPESFEILSSIPRKFRYRDDHSDLQNETTVVRLDWQGNVVGVRFNDRSASTPCATEETMERYYRAYRCFSQKLLQSKYQIRFLLKPGDLLIFDNERLLHGRTEFNPETGKRHLQGVYTERDEIASRIRMLGEELGLGVGDPAIPGGPRI